MHVTDRIITPSSIFTLRLLLFAHFFTNTHPFLLCIHLSRVGGYVGPFHVPPLPAGLTSTTFTYTALCTTLRPPCPFPLVQVNPPYEVSPAPHGKRIHPEHRLSGLQLCPGLPRNQPHDRPASLGQASLCSQPLPAPHRPTDGMGRDKTAASCVAAKNPIYPSGSTGTSPPPGPGPHPGHTQTALLRSLCSLGLKPSELANI